MSLESILLIGIFLILIATVVFLNKKLSTLSKEKQDQSLLHWLQTMQQSVETTNKTLHESLSHNSTNMVRTLQENAKQLNERLDKAAEVIGSVGKEVGQMSEIGRSMKELQDFLKSPKLRGNIGEEILSDLIGQMFPKHSFHLQYMFRSGEKVDAAITTDAGILPIDAKFPMENFQKMVKAENETEKLIFQKEFVRDVKKHIESISKKYILPEEGTMDFALMYIPSESVYYELANMPEVLNFARKLRVYLVSPSTLYIHLQTILLSFEGKKIETRSKEVFRLLRGLQNDYEKVQDNLSILGKHMTNASSQYTNLTTILQQFGTKLHKTEALEQEVVKELTK